MAKKPAKDTMKKAKDAAKKPKAEGLTAAQQKLPPALQAAIMKKKKG